MFRTLVLSHGELAQVLVDTARIIHPEGDFDSVEALCLDWQADLEDSGVLVSQAVERLCESEGLLILTDLCGSTPTRLALKHLDVDRVEVVTGVNLLMLLRIACLRSSGDSLRVNARTLREKACASIFVGSELQEKRRDEGPGASRGKEVTALDAGGSVDCRGQS